MAINNIIIIIGGCRASVWSKLVQLSVSSSCCYLCNLVIFSLSLFNLPVHCFSKATCIACDLDLSLTSHLVILWRKLVEWVVSPAALSLSWSYMSCDGHCTEALISTVIYYRLDGINILEHGCEYSCCWMVHSPICLRCIYQWMDLLCC